MDKSKVLIMLDSGHGSNTPGKQSPLFSDGITRLKEYAYVRQITYGVYNKLISEGYNVYIVHHEIEEIGTTNNDLKLRVNRANQKYNEQKQKGNTAIFISIHVNAAGNGNWYNARGWSVWTSKGQTEGDKLADKMYESAEEVLLPIGQKIRKDMSDGDSDYESNFYVLKNTNCPACLTENMFMDNKEDCMWLLSDEGVNSIIDIHVKGIKKYIESI